MTARLAALTKGLLHHSGLNNAQIAAVLGIRNQGRVSEIRTGKRFPEVDPEPNGPWVFEAEAKALELFGCIGPRR